MATGRIIALKAAAFIIPLLFPSALAQVSDQASSEAASTTTLAQPKTYESAKDGIRFNYSSSWVVDNSLSSSEYADSVEQKLGYMILATVCEQNQALPAIGGKFSCEDTIHPVLVMRHKDLNTHYEFSVLPDPMNITLDDFLAYEIEKIRDTGYSNSYTDIKIVNQTTTTVNMIAPSDNSNVSGSIGQSMKQLPARIVELSYRQEYSSHPLVRTELMTINGTTAYTVAYEDSAELNPNGDLPPPAKEIFDSFELIPSNATSASDAGQGVPIIPGNTQSGSSSTNNTANALNNVTEGIKKFFEGTG